MNKLLMAIMAFTTLFSVSAQAVKLADKKTMQNQLESTTDDQYLAEKYFPLVLDHAGSEKAPLDIAAMFVLVNYNFFEGIVKEMHPVGKSVLQMYINQLIPRFIRAILPNKDEANETSRIWSDRGRPLLESMVTYYRNMDPNSAPPKMSLLGKE